MYGVDVPARLLIEGIDSIIALYSDATDTLGKSHAVHVLINNERVGLGNWHPRCS